MATSYEQALNAIKQYYGEDSDIWKRVSEGSFTICEINQLVVNLPNVTVNRSQDGSIRGYDYLVSFEQSSNEDNLIDSNTQGGSFGGGHTSGGGAGRQDRGGGVASAIPANVSPDPTVQEDLLVSGMRDASSAVKNLVSTTLGAAWAGGASLLKWGKNFSNEIYDGAIGLWDSIFQGYNKPEYDKIATQDGAQSAIKGLIGINGNATTLYLPADFLAYSYAAMKDHGMFAPGQEAPPEYVPSGTDVLVTSLGDALAMAERLFNPPWPGANTINASDSIKNGLYNWIRNLGSGCYRFRFPCFGTTSFDGWCVEVRFIPSIVVGGTYRTGQTYRSGATQGYRFLGRRSSGTNITTLYSGSVNNNSESVSFVVGDYVTTSIAIYTNANTTQVPGYAGVTDQDGATIPDVDISGSTEDVLSRLMAAYPDLFNGAIRNTVVDDDCNTKEIVYVPSPIPYSRGMGDINPVGGTDQENPSYDPSGTFDFDTEQMMDNIDDLMRGAPGGSGDSLAPDIGDFIADNDPTFPVTPIVLPSIPYIPPMIGDGESPDAANPEGLPSALWSVYNPTISEINSFGRWLWSTDFVDVVERLFNSPSDAVYTLHKVPVNPPTGSSASIVCGFVTSPVTARTVTGQYVTLNCGEVDLFEYFGNVFDYDPYTTLSLFLPYIGFVQLDVATCMRSKLGVTYGVDVFTGACTARVSATRDGRKSIIAVYNGSCAVEYPISAGSYTAIASAIVNIGAGAILSGLTESPIPFAKGVGNAITNSRNQAGISGQFSGQHGAMAPQKPYLIISRPQPAMAFGFARFDGYPVNDTAFVRECSGHIKCKIVHLHCPNAYKEELDEIEMLLQKGVLV